MATTWILAADSSRARLFESTARNAPPRELRDFVNPEGRAQDRELLSDAQGRYFGKGERNQAHTAPPRTDPVEHDVDLFAKSLIDELERGRTAHRFNTVALIAPPEFLGRLRKHAGAELRKCVAFELARHCAHDDAEAIGRLVHELPAD